MGKIVEYDSKMNELNFGKFTEKELDLFFSICYEMKNEGVNEVTLTFQELKELSNYSRNDLKRFTNDLKSMYKKLLNITMELETEKKITGFVLFTDYEISKENRTVTIRVNEKYRYMLNEIEKFTKFDLIEFVSLKSSYAKNMFKLLKQFDNNDSKIKWLEIKIEKFREILSIPKSYKMSHIDSFVLVPIMEQLKPYFLGLKMEKIKKGRSIDSLKFTWREKKKKAKDTIAPMTKKVVLGEAELQEHEKIISIPKEKVSMVQEIEKITISSLDYEKLYKKYLEENNIDHNQFVRKTFDIVNKNKYEIIENTEPAIKEKIVQVRERKKVGRYIVKSKHKRVVRVQYQIDDRLLVSAKGTKLFGSAKQNKVKKILEKRDNMKSKLNGAFHIKHMFVTGEDYKFSLQPESLDFKDKLDLLKKMLSEQELDRILQNLKKDEKK